MGYKVERKVRELVRESKALIVRCRELKEKTGTQIEASKRLKSEVEKFSCGESQLGQVDRIFAALPCVRRCTRTPFWLDQIEGTQQAIQESERRLRCTGMLLEKTKAACGASRTLLERCDQLTFLLPSNPNSRSSEPLGVLSGGVKT
jgi:hypothetical protein